MTQIDYLNSTIANAINLPQIITKLATMSKHIPWPQTN